MNRFIIITLGMLIFINMLLPVFCTEKENDNDKVLVNNIYILRYVLAKFIIRIITILNTVIETNIDISLHVESEDAVEECYMLLQLLEISVERK